MPKPKPSTVTDYINASPKEARGMLKEIRAILKKAAPKAKEGLKWGVPMFEEKRILFAYAAFKTHLNFMPTPSVMKAFEQELKSYETGKGTIKLPYGTKIPKGLIRKIAMLRVKELREKDVRWM